jgi:hypothetical protein
MSVKEAFRKYFYLHFEWMALATGLLLMMFMEPNNTAASFCPLERLGFQYCPGDGLGNSIALAVRGHIQASLSSHLLGIPAILIISGRIFAIIFRNFNQKGVNHEKSIPTVT